MESIPLPIVTVQPTFPTVMQEVDDGVIPYEVIWISCYQSKRPSVHGKVQAILDERRRDVMNLVTKESDVEIHKLPQDRTYSVSCKFLDIPPTTIITPVQEYKDPEVSNPQRPRRITAFDVSPDQSQFAAGQLNGTVHLYPITPLPQSFQDESSFQPKHAPRILTASPHLKKHSKPHLSAVSAIKFFPSSRVLLTAGGDFSLTILPAEPFSTAQPTSPPSTVRPSNTTERIQIQPVRVMRSHTRSVTSIAIIAPGKNVLSASLDSTVKLWDVPTGSTITSLSSRSPILSMDIGERTPSLVDSLTKHSLDQQTEAETAYVPNTDSREVPETGSHLAFCGLSNGSFELFDLRTKHIAYRSSTSITPEIVAPSGSLTAVIYSAQKNLFMSGSSRGIVSVYDTRVLERPVSSFKRNDAGIEDLEMVDLYGVDGGGVGVAVATTDGLPFVANLSQPASPCVAAELVGADCDSVRNVKVFANQVWCASDDAVIRRYSLL
ncbi:hypothetical protein AX17_007459 [Amanita inopinata Kibby_2008]|nr:hypothetical protein AX17_007459 [Amanita inopinata Kibby_2008]